MHPCQIVAAVLEWIKAIGATKNQEIKVQQVMSWEPLLFDWFKLNVDGSRRGMSGAIGAWGFDSRLFGFGHPDFRRRALGIILWPYS